MGRKYTLTYSCNILNKNRNGKKPPMFSLFYMGLILELEHEFEITQFHLKYILYAVKLISNLIFTILFLISKQMIT